VLPDAFNGLLEKERSVIDVEGPDPELTKKVVIERLGQYFPTVTLDGQEEQTLSV